MFEIGKIFSHKPDHPMNSPRAARDQLFLIDESKPALALVEIATWAHSVAGADGFDCDNRFLVVAEIEEAGRKMVAEVSKEFLQRIHKRDHDQRKLFEALNGFWVSIAAAYERCVTDHETGVAAGAHFKEHLPLAIARAVRACERAERMRQLRYIGAGAEAWAIPCRMFAYAEKLGLDEVPLVVHEREVRSTIRAELLRMAGMSLAALHELPPDQVELAGRVMERFAISFAWSTERSADCNFALDLAAGKAPHQCESDEAVDAAKRYFGGGPALAKLAEIVDLVERNLLADEARFGPEYSQAQIVSVIRHLLIYLGKEPPKRRFARQVVKGLVSIANGFGAIAPRVHTLEAGVTAVIDDDLNVEHRKRQNVQLAAELADTEPEVWTLTDRSEWGVGTDVPQGLGAWAEPGVLCGIRDGENAPWWVGIVRSVEASEFGRTHCGMWIMSKKPIATHLRLIGNEEHKAANWETASGGIAYHYLRAILMPDAVKAHDRPVMLIEKHTIWIGELAEIMAGEHTRHIKIMELIEEGADYMRIGFSWMQPEKKP